MKSLIFGYGQTGKSFENYLENKSISFDIYDDDKSKLSEIHQEKNISPSFSNLKNYQDIYRKFQILMNYMKNIIREGLKFLV